MDNRAILIGALILILGIVFIGVSGFSTQEAEGYWYQGQGTNYRDKEYLDTIFFESGDRWTVENVSYLFWTSEDHSISLANESLLVSLYDSKNNIVNQTSCGELKELPTGLPVPGSGLYTIKFENISGNYTVSATYVRLVFHSETVSPYTYLFPAGIVMLLGGAATAAYGAVKRTPMRKQTKQKST